MFPGYFHTAHKHFVEATGFAEHLVHFHLLFEFVVAFVHFLYLTFYFLSQKVTITCPTFVYSILFLLVGF